MIILRQREYSSLFGYLFKTKKLKKQFEDERGISLEEYYKSNLPNNFQNTIDRIKNNINKLNNEVYNSAKKDKLDQLFFVEHTIEVESYDIDSYLEQNYSNINFDYIPIINFINENYNGIICINVLYDIKSKKFISTYPKIKPGSLKSILLSSLDIFYENMLEIEDELDDEFKYWKSQVYDKAKNVIKQIKI